MKHIILTTSILGLSALASQAAVTVIDTTSDRNTRGSSLGTGAEVQDTASGNQTGVLEIQVTGLTLDDFGTADDSINYTFNITAATGDTVFGGNGGRFTSVSAGGSNLVDLSETLTFSFNTASVALGAGGTQAAEIVFDGFTGFGLHSLTGQYEISGTASNNAADLTAAALDFTGFESAFTVSADNDPTASSFGVIDVDAQFTITTTTAVPEPSSTALLGLGGLALILRRRK